MNGNLLLLKDLLEPQGIKFSKVDKLDVDKLVPVSVDLSTLSDVVKNDVIKRLNVMNWLK